MSTRARDFAERIWEGSSTTESSPKEWWISEMTRDIDAYFDAELMTARAEIQKLAEEMKEFAGDAYGNVNGPTRREWADKLLAILDRKG